MTDFTPGPWFAEDADGPTNCEQYGNIRASIGVRSHVRYEAAVRSDDSDADDPDDASWICGMWGKLSAEDFANARLIAAAPDLLEALKVAREAIDDCLSYRSHLRHDARDLADAAIAKAESRQ